MLTYIKYMYMVIPGLMMKSDTLRVYKLGGIPVMWLAWPARVSIQYTVKSEQSGIILCSLTVKGNEETQTVT